MTDEQRKIVAARLRIQAFAYNALADEVEQGRPLQSEWFVDQGMLVNVNIQMTMSPNEYQREIEQIEGQEALNYELDKAAEGGDAA